MRILSFVILTLLSCEAVSDYGVPFIFQNCQPELDYASFEFDYVNNPRRLFLEDGKELLPEVKRELKRRGTIYPEFIESSECTLNGAKIRVWLSGSHSLSVSINGKTHVDNIDFNHRGFSFEKITFDGDSYPSGAESGFMKLCYYTKPEGFHAKDMFSLSFPYPNDVVIDTRTLRENAKKQSENSADVPKTCSLFDRF